MGLISQIAESPLDRKLASSPPPQVASPPPQSTTVATASPSPAASAAPSLPWPPALPCPTCRCPFAWHSVYDRELRCSQCQSQPPAGLIGGKLLAVAAVDPDLAALGAEPDPTNPADWRWRRLPIRWSPAMLERRGEVLAKLNPSDGDDGDGARGGDTIALAAIPFMVRDGHRPGSPDHLVAACGAGRAPAVYFGEVAPARGLCLGDRLAAEGSRVFTLTRYGNVQEDLTPEGNP